MHILRAALLIEIIITMATTLWVASRREAPEIVRRAIAISSMLGGAMLAVLQAFPGRDIWQTVTALAAIGLGLLAFPRRGVRR